MQLPACTLSVLLLATPVAARVAGGGPAATDCLAEFDGPGITATKGTRVECTDGDPACDKDGTCEGTCEFRVEVCANQCATPRTVERIEKVKGAALELPPLPAEAPACGGLTTVTTKKRKGKKPKPGKARLSLTAFADGAKDRDKLTLVCKPRTGPCPPPDHARRVLVDLPPLLVDPPRPHAGTAVAVTVDAPADAVTSLDVTGDGCGTLVSMAGVSGPIVQEATAGAFGSCDLAATVVPAGGPPQTYEASFTVIPIELDLPALAVETGIFVPGALPAQTGSPEDPIIAAAEAPGILINGGGAQIRLQLADPAQAATLRNVQVALDGAGGQGGYYDVPVKLDGPVVVLDLLLAADFVAPAGPGAQAAPGTVDADVQLVDQHGRVGNRVKKTFATQAVTTGPVQVSISWDTDTDVDLHLVEPDGTEIWWGSPTSPSGGALNVDSNAGCAVDGRRAENITYPTLPPPAPEGQAYVIKVDFWSDCATDTTPGQPAVVKVTIRVCGSEDSTEVRFAAGTSDMGGAGSGQVVARFDTSCLRAAGKAVYEDRIPRPSGFRLSEKTPPIRFATVEVRHATANVPLGKGTTKQDGTFDVPFTNQFGPGGYHVYVLAEQDDDLLKQVVIREGGKPYEVRSDEKFDEEAEPEKTDIVVKARIDDGTAAPFNIFDQGVEAAIFTRTRYGTAPPRDKELLWSWRAGQNGRCSTGVSCYDETDNSRRISVTGLPENTDEWDDSVLLHELGHFWISTFSRNDNPGGGHSGSRTVPTLAFAEGAATFFGQTVLDSSVYIDLATTERGTTVYSLDSVNEQKRLLGTSDGTQTGQVSEDVVAGVLWDLTDDLLAEPGDTVANRDAVFAAFSYLRGTKFKDRGFAGADLVDLLDGWFCLGHGNRGDATSGVQGVVTGLHQFPYDFATVADCR